MSKFRFSVAIALVFGLSGVSQACASARHVPNSSAFTFYPPSPSNAAPTATPTASAAPSTVTPAHTRTNTPASGPNSANALTATQDEPTKPKHVTCSSLPDPTPTRTDRWVELKLQFNRGKLDLLGATEQRSRRPEISGRKLGRFMAELWIGCELVDRVRFDFPLLALAPPKDSRHEPNFEAAAHFETTVRIPDSDRATRLELVDRANEQRQQLDWPLRLPAGDGKPGIGASASPAAPKRMTLP